MEKVSSFKIAVASGKGGTGKTFVSTNLFNVLRKKKGNVVLVDCDAEEPNDKEFFEGILSSCIDISQKVPVIDESKCKYCGKCANYCSYNAIFFLAKNATIRVMDDLCHGCGACSAACMFGAISEKDVLLGQVSNFLITEYSSFIEGKTKVGVHSPVKVIRMAIKEAKAFSIVILDSPPGTSCPFIQTVSQADYIVLVTEPTPFGLSDLKQSVETLKSLGQSCGVIINKAGLGDELVYEYLSKENIPLLMEIPFNRQIAESYSNGKLVTDTSNEWDDKFMKLFNIISVNYADINNKW